MGKIEAVIFDWAGTTVDYGCFAPVRAFEEAFRSFGIEVTMDEVRKPMGMLKWDHIKTMLSMNRIHDLWVKKYGREPENSDVDAIYAQFEPKLLSILKDYAEPKPYVLDAVKELRAMGMKIGSTTGYTDIMMDIVAPEAAKRGYAPDFWCSPDAVNHMGRPYPYMVFKNMEELKVSSVQAVVKVGDTVSDILEGVRAGAKSVGVLVGSSVIGLSEEEFEALSDQEKELKLAEGEKKFKDAGADFVIRDMRELLSVIREIEK